MLRESESLRPTPAPRPMRPTPATTPAKPTPAPTPVRPTPAPTPAGASCRPPDLSEVRFRPDRPRQPELLRQLDERQRKSTAQEMDIFEQLEMSKSRPQVEEELKGWYDWLVNHAPKPIKEKASRVSKTLKDKIMGLYKRVKGKKEPKESSDPIAPAGHQAVEPETTIDLIENQTRIRFSQS